MADENIDNPEELLEMQAMLEEEHYIVAPIDTLRKENAILVKTLIDQHPIKTASDHANKKSLGRSAILVVAREAPRLVTEMYKTSTEDPSTLQWKLAADAIDRYTTINEYIGMLIKTIADIWSKSLPNSVTADDLQGWTAQLAAIQSSEDTLLSTKHDKFLKFLDDLSAKVPLEIIFPNCDLSFPMSTFVQRILSNSTPGIHLVLGMGDEFRHAQTLIAAQFAEYSESTVARKVLINVREDLKSEAGPTLYDTIVKNQLSPQAQTLISMVTLLGRIPEDLIGNISYKGINNPPEYAAALFEARSKEGITLRDGYFYVNLEKKEVFKEDAQQIKESKKIASKAEFDAFLTALQTWVHEQDYENIYLVANWLITFIKEHPREFSSEQSRENLFYLHGILLKYLIPENELLVKKAVVAFIATPEFVRGNRGQQLAILGPLATKSSDVRSAHSVLQRIQKLYPEIKFDLKPSPKVILKESGTNFMEVAGEKKRKVRELSDTHKRYSTIDQQNVLVKYISANQDLRAIANAATREFIIVQLTERYSNVSESPEIIRGKIDQDIKNIKEKLAICDFFQKIIPWLYLKEDRFLAMHLAQRQFKFMLDNQLFSPALAYFQTFDMVVDHALGRETPDLPRPGEVDPYADRKAFIDDTFALAKELAAQLGPEAELAVSPYQLGILGPRREEFTEDYIERMLEKIFLAINQQSDGFALAALPQLTMSFNKYVYNSDVAKSVESLMDVFTTAQPTLMQAEVGDYAGYLLSLPAFLRVGYFQLRPGFDFKVLPEKYMQRRWKFAIQRKRPLEVISILNAFLPGVKIDPQIARAPDWEKTVRAKLFARPQNLQALGILALLKKNDALTHLATTEIHASLLEAGKSGLQRALEMAVIAIKNKLPATRQIMPGGQYADLGLALTAAYAKRAGNRVPPELLSYLQGPYFVKLSRKLNRLLDMYKGQQGPEYNAHLWRKFNPQMYVHTVMVEVALAYLTKGSDEGDRLFDQYISSTFNTKHHELYAHAYLHASRLTENKDNAQKWLRLAFEHFEKCNAVGMLNKLLTENPELGVAGKVSDHKVAAQLFVDEMPKLIVSTHAAARSSHEVYSSGDATTAVRDDAASEKSDRASSRVTTGHKSPEEKSDTATIKSDAASEKSDKASSRAATGNKSPEEKSLYRDEDNKSKKNGLFRKKPRPSAESEKLSEDVKVAVVENLFWQLLNDFLDSAHIRSLVEKVYVATQEPTGGQWSSWAQGKLRPDSRFVFRQEPDDGSDLPATLLTELKPYGYTFFPNPQLLYGYEDASLNARQPNADHPLVAITFNDKERKRCILLRLSSVPNKIPELDSNWLAAMQLLFENIISYYGSLSPKPTPSESDNEIAKSFTSILRAMKAEELLTLLPRIKVCLDLQNHQAVEKHGFVQKDMFKAFLVLEKMYFNSLLKANAENLNDTITAWLNEETTLGSKASLGAFTKRPFENVPECLLFIMVVDYYLSLPADQRHSLHATIFECFLREGTSEEGKMCININNASLSANLQRLLAVEKTDLTSEQELELIRYLQEAKEIMLNDFKAPFNKYYSELQQEASLARSASAESPRTTSQESVALKISNKSSTPADALHRRASSAASLVSSAASLAQRKSRIAPVPPFSSSPGQASGLPSAPPALSSLMVRA